VFATALMLVAVSAESADTCGALRARTAAVDRDAGWPEIDYLKSLMPYDCLEAQSQLFYGSHSYMGKNIDDCRPNQKTIQDVENTSTVCGCSRKDALDFWYSMCEQWRRMDAAKNKWWKWK
jgi:hypothetical protein